MTSQSLIWEPDFQTAGMRSADRLRTWINEPEIAKFKRSLIKIPDLKEK